MKLQFHGASWDHYQHWVENDKSTLRKLNRLITESQRHPYEGTGIPEPLKGDLNGHWSRRINRQHRLVYRVEEGTLIIVQCRYNY